jgi:hypothetical protein
MLRSVGIAIALTVSLAGCRRIVFDHAHGAGDAGRSVREDCAGADDGAACDDRDVCTPSSSCRAERCEGGNAFDSCTVADSEDDFGREQGEGGWFYGYWNASADPDGSYDSGSDFSPMEYCGDENWRPPGRCDTDPSDPEHRWTMNLAWGLQHPDTDPDVELPVRRWISDASGPARILAEHHVDGMYSDGTRALLLFDGREIWRNDAAGGDVIGAQASVDVELELGSIVEQLVHPIESDADDTTYFGITITGR